MTKNPLSYRMSDNSARQDSETPASKSAVEPKGAASTDRPDAGVALSPARAALMAAVDAQTQWRLKTLSLALGCNHAYLQQYVKRASPRYLPEHIRLRLCQLLQLPADALREEMPKTSRIEYEGVREAEPPAPSPPAPSPAAPTTAAACQIERLQMRDLHRDLHPYITAEMLGDGQSKSCPFYLGDEPADDLRLWQIPAGHSYQDSDMPAMSGGDQVVVQLIQPEIAEYGPLEDRPSEDRKALYLIFDGRQLCLQRLDDTAPHKNTPIARDYMYIIGRAVALWRDFS